MGNTVYYKQRFIFYLLTYIIWPFGLFFTAISNISQKSSRFMFACVGFYLGYSMNVLLGSDGSRIGYRFIENIKYSNSDFFVRFLSTYSSEDANPDFYLSTITFLISRISSSQNFFFGVLGFVYFYFFSKFYSSVVSIIKVYNIIIKRDILLVFILIGISLVFPLSAGINAVRFPLATYVYFFSILAYIMSNEKKFILLNAITFLIHWSFIPLVLVFFISIILNKIKNRKIIKLIFVALFVLSSLLSQTILNNSILKGSSIENKYELYSDENYIEDRDQHLKKLNFHIQLSKYLPYYFSIIVLVLFNISMFKVEMSQKLQYLNILAVLLLVFALVFGNDVGLLNNRFIKISFMATMLLLGFAYLENQKSLLIRNLMIIYLPIGLLQLYSVVRTDFEVFNLASYFGNYFILNSSEDFLPIMSLIK